jgi:predicted PhzF superfamily epimerase YddE/YHI9
MTIPIHQVDAFTGALFGGNPAAVCPLDAWLDAQVMQAIAAENNLAETAFFVPEGDRFGLRWFTPLNEVDLCGHATLAAGFVVLDMLRPEARAVTFETRSGTLTVAREATGFSMDLPTIPSGPCLAPDALSGGLRAVPAETRLATNGNFMAVFADETAVAALDPDMGRLASLHPGGVIATAPADSRTGGMKVDFVSRFFAPSHGVPEDPVTGSAHCTLAPYWSARLGKRRLVARQISRRGGDLVCEWQDDRTRLEGQAVLYMSGALNIGSV